MVRELWILEGILCCRLGRGGPKSHNVTVSFVLNMVMLSLPGCPPLLVCLVLHKAVVMGQGHGLLLVGCSLGPAAAGTSGEAQPPPLSSGAPGTW